MGITVLIYLTKLSMSAEFNPLKVAQRFNSGCLSGEIATLMMGLSA
jgi:hypothetical protein